MKSLMRTVVASLLLVAVLTGSTSQPSAATADPVQISYVVSRLANSTSLYEGSLKGGTALYIHGVGFDPSASNNQIFVGSYPCDTSAKGVTLDTITCDTTVPTGTSLYNLPVTVMVAGKPPVTCTSTSCMFSYTWQGTPYLYGVYPRAGAANEQIKFYGIHRISQLGDGRSNFDNIRGLYIGGSMCSRFDIIESPIDPNSNQFITCAIPPIQAGGYYNVSEWVAPGYADKNARMQYGSISQGVNYEFMVQPRVKSVSSHLGGDFGQTLTISGDGFSINSTQISVSAANIPCDVVSSTESQITCKVQPNPNGNTFGVLDTNTSGTQLSGFLSGSGLKYKRYDITNLSSKNLPNFRNNIGSANVTLVEDSWRSDLMSADVYGSNYVQVFKGYFVAPAAGDYIFRGLADDAIELFLSNVKGSAEVDYSAPLISGQYYSNSYSSRNYYVANYSGLTSAPITMAAGEARYLEVYHLNGYGNSNMLISVEVPNSNTNFANQVYEVQQVTLAPG